jgi:hypothetical protein
MLAKNLKSKLYGVIGSLSITGLLLAGVIAAAPTSTALAAPGTPPAKQGQSAQTADARLEQAYQREQTWLNQQADNLTKMNDVADKVQQFITTQQGKGKDVTALQAALTTFKSQIATAQSTHKTAANVLSTHTGFDANGKVTDTVQARQTVLEARQALRAAHDVMQQAVTDLHRAVRDWRQANGEKAKKPAATPSH